MRFVPSEELKLGTVIGRDIIFTARKTAMLKKGTVLNERYIEYLQDKGYLGAYVSDDLSNDVQLEETVDQEIFQEGVEAVMDENIEDMLEVSSDIVTDILNKREICTDLIDLRSFDDYTYHHSVNVAVYAVLVGKQMGLKIDDLNLICQAGLLHDLGKSKIPEEILNKPGKLTDDEYKVIQQHAQYSFDIISESFEVSSVVKQAVLCHHENENGSGYPNGKEGSEISILSKIIHAVDVYDALTSKRPYKEPYEPANAFEYMKSGKGIQFNESVVDALIEVIPPYPAGIDIYLSDGQRALVIDHSQNKMRPIIRIVATGETVNLATDDNYKDIKIERSGLIPIGEDQGKIHDLNESRSAVKLLKKKIYIIDPNRKSRMQIESILENDAHLCVFDSAFDALGYAKENGAPDLVITEVTMPVMDGITATTKMREATNSTFPIIFITGDNSANTILKARALKKTDYILKPANPVYIKERTYHALYNIDPL